MVKKPFISVLPGPSERDTCDAFLTSPLGLGRINCGEVAVGSDDERVHDFFRETGGEFRMPPVNPLELAVSC